ncbi:MAG TPA: Crp/Fnr family transcriptional regulator [Dissulfurispiraceae bacterium]|nr:Crp/Fnr family transcriptional regulator [Dissulfurispiraceae bacterium]
MNIPPDLYGAFGKVQMFSSLNIKEIGEIVAKVSIKDYQKDDVILWEGDANPHMYLVLSGRVKVVQAIEDGRELIRAIHESGDLFGELSLMDSVTSPAEVVAMDRTSVAIIDRENFLKIIHTHHKVLNNLIQMFCTRLRNLWERAQIINFKSPEQRLNLLFHQLSADYGEQIEEGTLLNIRLTHQTLASMTGLCRETVTRALDALKRDKYIKIHKGDKKVILLPAFLKCRSALGVQMPHACQN